MLTFDLIARTLYWLLSTGSIGWCIQARKHWLMHTSVVECAHSVIDDGNICRRSHHDDVIKWKHFPRYWPFVRGIHRSPVNSRTKASDAELWCFIHLCLTKRLSKQSWGWWFGAPSRSLWRHCNDIPLWHVYKMCASTSYRHLATPWAATRLYKFDTSFGNAVVLYHYSDVTLTLMLVQQLGRGHIKNIIAPHYWPIVMGNSRVTSWWIPWQSTNKTEIFPCHYVIRTAGIAVILYVKVTFGVITSLS